MLSFIIRKNCSRGTARFKRRSAASLRWSVCLLLMKGDIMREKLARFFAGRNGVDQLGRAVMIVTVILLVVSMFTSGRLSDLLFVLVLIGIIYMYFRMFSRNISKRYAENEAFLNRTYKVRSFFQKQINIWKQRRVYHIYTCPGCRQKIRIPRGKGKIEIRCPKCGTTFIKKS